MSVVQHDAVIAMVGERRIEEIKRWIENNAVISGPKSPWNKDLKHLFLISEMLTNGYFAVVMVPDGSGEGMDTSDRADVLRRDFIAFLSDRAEFIHVGFGERGITLNRG